MKIISMTATFGKLDAQTLELTEGLNLICAPNEWGKSTWCAFLTAMLYGIDTRERSTRDQIAGKERYLPWSGRPMEGLLRLEWKGRDITIQRRTRGRTPMGDFAAYETRTGLPVEELQADTCGQTLLGVERSVFVRTGFIRFTDLPVQADDALRRRLNALVTTGDESGGGELLAKKLREYQNRCRYNRTGLIPQAQQTLQDLEQQLQQRQTLQTQISQLQQQIHSAEERLAQLQTHRDALAHARSAEATQQLRQAADLAREAQNQWQQMASRCQSLPPREELNAKLTQAQAILRQIDATPIQKRRSPVGVVFLWILTALFALAGAFALSQYPIAGLVGLGAGAILALSAIIATVRRSRRERKRLENEAALDARQKELLTQTSLWREQLGLVDQAEQLRRDALEAKTRLQSLIALAKQTEAPRQEDALDLPPEQTQQELTRTTDLLNQSRIRLGQCQGRMDELPDSGILTDRIALTKNRLRQLEKTYRALDLGQQALDAAAKELQRRFAPRITRRAGQFLNRLTQGRYDRISIDDDLTVQAAQGAEVTLRTAQWRSDGTADQMYLALRLAVWEALAPEAPLILDDALIRFDESRLGAALELLSELSGHRQILLFSCQEREKRWAQTHG